MNLEFNTVFELLRHFDTESKCIAYLKAMRWEDEPVSPYDPASKVYRCKHHQYKCKNTSKYFNVKTNTLFHNTKVPLVKWFLAIWFITSHKKGISSIQLAKDLGVTQKTSWFMLHRIRNCFKDQSFDLCNEVEVDETFIGGKNKNRHRDKKVKNSQGRAYKDKVPVFGMLERGGKLIAKVVPDTSGPTLKTIIWEHVDFKTILHTDDWIGYNGLHKEYDQRIVEHAKGIYGTEITNTNTIEGAWSILKRMIIGIYHSTSKKHLQKYVDEFVFRYNYRKFDAFRMMFENIENRLIYKSLIDVKEKEI